MSFSENLLQITTYLSTNALFRWPLYKFSDSFLQIQLNPSKNDTIFASFWTISALVTSKNPKIFARRVFVYFYKLPHEFLQIVAWFSTNCTFLQIFCRSQNPSTNVTFFFYKCDFPKTPLYKFHRFLLQFFLQFSRGGANYLVHVQSSVFY